MAQITVIEISWKQTSPFGEFVAGDLVQVLYDTSTTQIVVKKNGGVVTSGDSIPKNFNYNGRPASYYKTEVRHDALICSSTTRVELKRDISSFPYATKYLYAGSPSCAVSPIVCDLEFNSLPAVSNETTSGALDGSVTVSANGSNGAIEYNIGADFIYGAGQSSGTFTGLTAGTYTIFARDSANCATDITVSVGLDRVYGELYRLEYDDLNGDTTRLEIQERDYAGAVEEVDAAGQSPVYIRTRGEGEEDKFIPLLGVELEVNLNSDTNFKFLGLFTSDPNKYRVVFKKDFGGGFETLLTTKLLPNQYKEEYFSAPYPVQFLCTDGLASLSDTPFTDTSGNRFFGVYKCIELIAFCLKNTGLNLNIRVAANIYADGMDETASDDPLDQAYIDTESYYLNSEIPSCLDVLKFILTPFCAQLVQWDNVWNIVRVEEKVEDYDYREFDDSGAYVSNGNFDPVVNSQGASVSNGVTWERSPVMEMNPAYGKIKLAYNLGLKENIIKNGDFKLKTIAALGEFLPVPDIVGFQVVPNGDDGVLLGYQVINENSLKPQTRRVIINGEFVDIPIFSNVIVDKNNIAITLSQAFGNAYILSKDVTVKMDYTNQLKFTIRCAVPTFATEVPYVKIRCLVSYDVYYLQGDGTWTTTATEIIFYCKEYGKFNEYSVTTTEQPDTGASDGYELNIKVYHAYANHAEFDNLTDQRAKVTTTLGLGHRTEREDAAGFDLFYYQLENNTSAESVPDIVRPDDYNAGTNPVQWILKAQRDTGVSVEDIFFIDKLDLDYFFNGSNPPELFESDQNAEDNNTGILTKELVHGSLIENVQTITRITPIWSFNPATQAQIDYIELPIQNAEHIYCGYFRDSAGVGFENWGRDYFAESIPLHEIFLKSCAAQYNAPWRRLRGTLTSPNKDIYLTPLNSIKEVIDSDRKYYPVSMNIDDRGCSFSGEYVELSDLVTDDDGDTGVGFSTGFSLGFNA